MSKHHHRDKSILALMLKNKPLISGLAATLLVILFVSSVLFMGKSSDLSSLTGSQAATVAVSFSSVTCSSVTVNVSAGVSGSFNLEVWNAAGQKITSSDPFVFPTLQTRSKSVNFNDALKVDGKIKIIMTQNSIGFGTYNNSTNEFNVQCSNTPVISFSNAACNAISVASNRALAGQFTLTVLDGGGNTVARSAAFTFTNGTSARVTISPALTTSDTFAFNLTQNGQTYGRQTSHIFNLTCNNSSQPTISFANATCNAITVNSNRALTGQYSVNVLDGEGNTVARSAAFALTNGITARVAINPALTTSDAFAFNLTQNGRTYGTQTSHIFNLNCGSNQQPTISFTNPTCTSVTVNSSIALTGNNYNVVVRYKPTERGTLGAFVTQTNNVTLNGRQNTVTFSRPINSDDYFSYYLQKGGTPYGVIDPVTNFAQLQCYSDSSTVLGNVTATCDNNAQVKVTWTKDTRAASYAVEVFKPASGAGGTRVYGLTNTANNSLTFTDPDITAGGTYTADVYAKAANGSNIVGPIFSQPFTCPGTPPVACVNKDIMMVMDTSGSMSGDKIRGANQAAKNLISQLPSGNSARAGLVGFGTHASLLSGLTNDFNALASKINLRASGGTNMADGVRTAAGQFSSTGKTNIVVLLSDGKPNLPRDSGVGPNDDAAFDTGRAAATSEIANAALNKKTVFYTIGLGSKSNLDSSWLNAVASATGGKHYYAASSDNLSDLFTNMTKDLCRETPNTANGNIENSLNAI